jgi:MarR family transcriptional regulator, organic hydroperoxide resistance regulator
MSISKLRRARTKAAPPTKRGNGAAGYVLPPTVSRGALLERGSDRRFRTLVGDLFTIAARMEVVREHLGRRLGISGPQYSLLIAVAHLQGGTGVSVGAVAQAMHVSSAFVASETGKMARLGLLLKRANPEDGRGVLLSLAPGGRLKVDRIAIELRAINDLFFDALDSKSFDAFSAAASALVGSSRRALDYVHAMEGRPGASLDAAG